MKREQSNTANSLNIGNFLQNLGDGGEVSNPPTQSLEDFLDRVKKNINRNQTNALLTNTGKEVGKKGNKSTTPDELISAICKLCSSPIAVEPGQLDVAKKVKGCLIKYIDPNICKCQLKF